MKRIASQVSAPSDSVADAGLYAANHPYNKSKSGRVLLTLQIDRPGGTCAIVQATLPIQDDINTDCGFDDKVLQDCVMILMEQLDAKMRK